MEGTVYVLTNPAMPNMVKIGKTTRDVELRLADLYSTGVPLPFECEYAAKVNNVDKTEKDLKAVFPKELWNKLHLQIIFFGREYCPARGHDLTTCPICSWTATKKRIKEEMKR